MVFLGTGVTKEGKGFLKEQGYYVYLKQFIFMQAEMLREAEPAEEVSVQRESGEGTLRLQVLQTCSVPALSIMLI